MQNKKEIIEKSLELLNKAVNDGISNYKIAKDTKITEATIGNYINGKTKPTLANASILIAYFTDESKISKIQTNVKYISPYLNEDLVQLPYVPIAATASFVESLYGEPYIDETFGVLFEDGEYTNHTEYRVFNISGDSMEPTIRNRSKVLCKEISMKNWEYAKGVIVIVYGKTLTIKRILKNDLYIHNTLSLKADNPTYGEIVVERSEIKGIWQALRVVSMEIV